MESEIEWCMVQRTSMQGKPRTSGAARCGCRPGPFWPGRLWSAAFFIYGGLSPCCVSWAVGESAWSLPDVRLCSYSSGNADGGGF